MNDYADSAARFKRETAKHEMMITRDDGLFRQLRFADPQSGLYWYEITTTPGQLTFSGDGASFVFRLAPDMFEMFRRTSMPGEINPQYWAEKCKTGNARSYSRERFEEYVERQVAENESYYKGLRDDVREEIFDSPIYNVDHEPAALMTVLGYEYWPDSNPEHRGPFRFRGVYEWDVQDWDWWFLFACYAINDAITQYDAAKAPKAVAS